MAKVHQGFVENFPDLQSEVEKESKEKQHPVKADMYFHICRGIGCNQPIPFDYVYCKNCKPFERDIDWEDGRGSWLRVKTRK